MSGQPAPFPLDLVRMRADRMTKLRDQMAGQAVDAVVVLDVHDRDARAAGAVEQLGGLVERGLHPHELHRPAGVGVLAVDHDERGLGEGYRLDGQTGERTQRCGHDRHPRRGNAILSLALVRSCFG